MHISQAGIDLIKGFESYLKPLPDGSCTTYICPAGKPTIGFGCTIGVKVGDVWTRQEAEDGLRRELGKAESAVSRLVTVEMTQPQFDALVSFAYNCGDGALASSSILRLMNKGDVAGAAASFSAWNRARKGGKGAKVEMRGLTRRRAAEKALFLSTPDDQPNDPMPQKIEPPSQVSKPLMVAGGASGGGLALGFLADPVGMTTAAVAVKSNAALLLAGVNLTTWGVPIAVLLIVACVVIYARRQA